MTRYLIAEVAERSGFSPPTLRYYEEIGLLPPAERGDNGYRMYGEATLERLGFIARAKQLDCTLEEITALTRAWEDGQCGPVQQQLQALIDAKAGAAQARIAELTVLVADLRRAEAGLRAHTPDGPCDDRCGCMRTPEVDDAAAPVALALTAKHVGDRDVPVACGGDEMAVTGGPVVGDDEVPIACTLGAGDMPGRLDEWRALLEGVTARSPLDDGIRLEFGAAGDVAEIARLAAAEQACCGFFSFAVVVDQRGVALEVRAPTDGQAVLTALFGAAV